MTGFLLVEGIPRGPGTEPFITIMIQFDEGVLGYRYAFGQNDPLH